MWGEETLGLPIHDNWWQTETGGIMIANFAATEIRPGSMGRPLPGIEAAVACRDERGRVIVRDGAPVLAVQGDEGELILRAGWPSMFRGYLHDERRYREAFAGDWYLSGDLVRQDADGYFWFVGRGDDVIKSAEHLIGPFEVESALMEHPAVAEAGVIGVPDAVAGERVKAFGVWSTAATRPARSCGASCAHTRGRGSAPPSRRRRSPSPTPCRTPAAARSCAGSCAPASSGCRRATCPRWRTHEPAAAGRA